MHTRWRNCKGQALVMVTISLLAMLGIMGLAVDFGWAFFIRKAAQGAADSAALAAVQAGLNAVNSGASLDCATLQCSAPVPCAGAGGNFANGCAFAAKNGFNGNNGQTVTIEGDLGANRLPANAPGIVPQYWVTVRVRQNIPQLFSAVLGNTNGTSGARATAAITSVPLQGALILLNRQSDCIAMNGPNSVVCGLNLAASGNTDVNAKSGIIMASTRHDNDLGIPRDGSHHAAEVQGGGKIRADFSAFRGAGTANVSQADTATWDKPWTNGMPDSDFFKDPMRKLQQPPPPSSSLGLPGVPIAGCTIVGSADPANPLRLTPGKYYSVQAAQGGGGCSAGDPIQVQGAVEFLADASGFGNYEFFGGLKTTTSTNITFNPGRYVFAGVKPKAGQAGSLFDATSGQVVLKDKTPLDASGQSQANTDAGELFLFTNKDYPGLDTSGVPSSVLTDLTFGTSGFQTGANSSVMINLHGLNKSGTGFPPELNDYAPVIFWQDQRNSAIKYYNADGTKNMACIVGDTACVNALAYANSPMLQLQASSTVHLYGIVYQPRGSWTEMTGGDKYSGPLRIITGAISLNGGADLNLMSLNSPMFILSVALIE